jgi:hypothetical protein
MEILTKRKMKKSVYKSGTLLAIAAACLLSFSLTAEEVTKDIHKEFNAGAATTLSINNRYGDVVVQSWNKDQIVIDVKITVDMSDKERAEKYLSYINVQFSENNDVVSAKTVFDDKFNSSSWGSSKRFSIDYTVRMPAKASLDLKNRYGNTDIDQVDGLAILDVQYGDLSVDKLTRGKESQIDKISISYGKCSVDEAGWLDIYARYSPSVEVEKSKALLLDCKYSKIKIGETSSIVADSKYDGITIDQINNLVIQTGYTTLRIGTLTKQLNYQGNYGSLDVNEIPSGFESIEVKTAYQGVKLGIDENASYMLDAHSSYGGIKFPDENYKNGKRIIENNSSTIEGTVGKEKDPKSTVKISSSYGNVKLY